MNIYKKTIFIISLIIIFLACFFLVQGLTNYHNQLRLRSDRDKRQIFSDIKEIEYVAFTPYTQRIKSLLTIHPEIVRAFAKQDRQALYRLSLPIFRAMRDENPFFRIMHFHLPGGDLFVDMYQPVDNQGYIHTQRPILQAVDRDKIQKTGFEIGYYGALWRVVQPVFYNERFVGSVEFGVNAEQLIDILKNNFDLSAALYFMSSRWEKAEGVTRPFIRSGNSIILAQPGSLFERAGPVFRSGGDEIKIRVGDRRYLASAIPIFSNYQGDTIGGLVVLEDITGLIKDANRFLVRSVAITVLVLFVSFMVLFLVFYGLVNRMEAYRRGQLGLIRKIEENKHSLELKVQERTQMLLEANERLEKEVKEHKEAKEAILRHELFLESVFNGIQDEILVLGLDLTIQAGNQSLYRQNRLFSVPGPNKCFEVFFSRTEPCDGCPALMAISSRSLQRAQVERQDLSGNIRYLEVFAYPVFDEKKAVIGVVEFLRDITEKKKTEEEKERIQDQLIHAQKMEAVGTLAGGVAHDFNNMLTAIQGFVELSLMQVAPTEPIYRNLKQIHRTALRAADVVRQLLLFSRRQPMRHEPLDMNRIVEGMRKMLERLIGEDIFIETRPSDKPALLEGDRGNLEQVIMNLALNARDAMEEGGKIIVSTSLVTIGKEYCDQYPYARLGYFVRLAVEDTGKGMSPEILDHIFEPFFTTKGQGKGTGLGLAVVYGIVKEHQGWINCHSREGEGTIFEVFLPALSGDLLPEAKNDDVTYSCKGKGQRILILEDDEAVRRMAATVLQNAGYHVFEAGTVKDAFELFERHKDGLDLLFSDVVLPDGNGLSLVEKILNARPQLPVIMASGYTDDRSLWKDINARKLTFLRKPYKLKELLISVNEGLARAWHNAHSQ